MEKIEGLSLDRIGQIILENIRGFFRNDQKDNGIEWKFQSNEFQEMFTINFFDELTFIIKIFPHKNIIRERVFRIEVYQSQGGEMRGHRIACVEIPKSDTVEEDIKSFIQGVLSRTGAGKPDGLTQI